MTPTTLRTLAALDSVGDAAVTIRISARVCAPAIVVAVAGRHAPDVSANEFGDVTIAANGDSARTTFHRFTAELLAAAREQA